MSTTPYNQLNDLRSYSRHWLGEFIEMYESEQCLWQSKHPDYSNHTARNKAYDRLVEKLKEVEPNPDRAMVVRKINSLRSAFRREYRKSVSRKFNYETRLWYYDKLLFIADQNPKRVAAINGGGMSKNEPKRSLGLNFDDEGSMEFEEEHIEPQHPDNTIEVTTGSITANAMLVKNEEHHQTHHQHQPQQHQQQHIQLHQEQHAGSPQQQQHSAATVKVLEITSLDSNSQREIQQAVNSLEHQHHVQQQLHQQQTGQIHQQVPTIQIAREHLQPLFGNSHTFTATATPTHRQDDEYDAIGVNVASKLRTMNPTQRIIAEKLIADVLFNAQLDNLTVNSALTQ